MVCLLLWSGIMMHAAAGKKIYLRSRTIETERQPKLAPQAVERPVSGLFLIQFESIPGPELRNALKKAGVKLLRFVPENAFIASLKSTRMDNIASLSEVFWIGEYRTTDKTVPRMLRVQQRRQDIDQLNIRLLLSPDADQIIKLRDSFVRIEQTTRLDKGTVLQGTIPTGNLHRLLESDSVLWLEPAPKPRLYDEVSTKIVAGPNPTNGHPAAIHALGFDGTGVTVAVADSGLNNGDSETMHPDLKGRVDGFFYYGGLTSAADGHGHGTHVAGIVAGNGATGETDDNDALYGLGVAPGAHIIAQRIFDSEGNYEPPSSMEKLARDAVRGGADIGSNSWGDDTQGRYDLSAAVFDALVRDADAITPGDQPYILEFSAGNSGPAPKTIGSPAVGKNVIATGASQNNRFDLYIYDAGQEAMADFSSRGPCEDGRIKPDVTAPGTWIASLQSGSASGENAWLSISANYQYQGGTSQSGPHVSGAAALFVQYYRETITNTLPSPALVKAALINSAVDMANAFGTGYVPNNEEGWGRIDLTRLIGAQRAYRFIDQAVTLTNSQSYTTNIVVAAPDIPLRITMTYTDYPGNPAAIPALVNDIDLTVTGPDGSIYCGNQFENGESIPGASSHDNINNVENIFIPNPTPGEYTVTVTATRIAEDSIKATSAIDQDFALVVSGNIPSPGTSIIVLDKKAYSVPDTIRIKVIDFDMPPGSHVVNVSSATEQVSEEVAITNSSPPGIATGFISTATSQPAPDGLLQISHGDEIHVDYYDASLGSNITAIALADLVPPQISSVNHTNALGKSIVTWITDEPSDSTVHFGISVPPTQTASNQTMSTNHQVVLTDLEPEQEYYYQVVSTDPAGNTTTNDNSGNLFVFTSEAAATILLVDAYEPDAFTEPIPLAEYTNALEATEFEYEVWSVAERNSPTFNDLKPFHAVIWRVTDSVYSESVITSEQQQVIRQYIDNDGAFLLASMEQLTRLQLAGSTAFMSNVLHVTSFKEDAEAPGIEGVDYDPISSDVSLTLDYSLYPSIDIFDLGPDFSDSIQPTTNAAPVLLDTATGDTVGLRYPKTGSDSTGRVVFLSFPLDAIPMEGAYPNSRPDILNNILKFLVPGAGGVGTIALNNTEYTAPDMVVVDVADADLADSNSVEVIFSSDVMEQTIPVTLKSTAKKGVFRGFITTETSTNANAADKLFVTNNGIINAEYFDVSANLPRRAAASIDLIPPTLSGMEIVPGYQSARVSWNISEDTEAIVQFGESRFLSRSAYSPGFSTSQTVELTGLLPNRTYFFKLVSRDKAGNTGIDDNAGKLYTFKTLDPISPPWADDFENDSEIWQVSNATNITSQWRRGTPRNNLVSEAHSPVNAWCTNLEGIGTDYSETLLVSPAFLLEGGDTYSLSFWHAYDFSEKSEFDILEYGTVYISTNHGANWEPLKEYFDTASNWTNEEIDITAYEGSTVRIGFNYFLLSLDNIARPGWIIDDFSITSTNIQAGTVLITNNIAQASFQVSGPTNFSGVGRLFTVSNAPAGTYSISYNSVPYYSKPDSATNTLSDEETAVFHGEYDFQDSNTNGISDEWELHYFGDIDPGRTKASDSDGDGASDYAEFIAGTDPTDASDVFRIREFDLPPNGTASISWNTTTGRIYRIQGSTNLVDWLPYSEWEYSNTNLMRHTFPKLPMKRLEFRIQVQP